MEGGLWGKILGVNLSGRNISVEKIPEPFLREGKLQELGLGWVSEVLKEF